MKCEIIRDLLPLYIDGLTSKESNQEIEKHLKNCEECQKYYQEMTGDIDNFSVITNEEIEDVNMPVDESIFCLLYTSDAADD